MATVPAIVGTARLGNFRLGYQPAALQAIRQTKVRILLAGTDVSVRVAGLSIRDVLNESPNTCSLKIDHPPPTSGQALRITINSDAPRLLFAGTIQTDDLTYEGKPTQLVYPCTAVDDTFRVNKRRPFGTFTNVSATTVAQTLVSSDAPGFSASGIAASLPTVTITFDGSTSFMGCFAQLATLIGGYCNAEDGVVSLFLTDTSDPPDDIDSTPGRFLDNPPITVSRDDSQLATRVYGKGHAEAVPVDVAIGETVVPVMDSVMYNPLGGQVIASTTPDGAASEILTYTGIQNTAAAAQVGPGAAPSVAPLVQGRSGAGMSAGTRSWAYSFVTAAGETIPSPARSLTLGTITAPVALVEHSTVYGGFPANGIVIGDTVDYAYSYGAGATDADISCETDRGPSLTIVKVVDPNFGAPYWRHNYMTFLFSEDPQVSRIHFWRRVNGGSWQLATDNTLFNYTGFGTTPQLWFIENSTFAVTALTPAPTPRQAAISGVALGPTGTTARKVWRTEAGLSQLKLQQTIANNTSTTGVQDATADASLGANAPTTDTSGLIPPFGQVNAGSASILTAGTGVLAAPGWVLTQSGDYVRYASITGNSLTDIPTSGVGAILNTVYYGDTLIAVPALTGVTGLTKALMKGSPVHLWVQRDDGVAQAAAAARESTTGYTSDGIHEITISDERRGEASLIARCDAHLALFANPIVTVQYATRDVKTKSGKPVDFNLTSPAIVDTLVIQDVTITEIDVAPRLAPRFTVTASSVRFTLEDLLRRMNALLEN